MHSHRPVNSSATSSRVAKRGLGDASRVAMDKGRYAASATDDYVRANPWPAVGVALVTGLVAGVLIGRR